MVFFFPKETNSLFFDLAFKDLTFSVFTDIFLAILILSANSFH